MPTCTSCKKSNDAWMLTEDGLCPICASISMKAHLSLNHQQAIPKPMPADKIASDPPASENKLATIPTARYEYTIMDMRGDKRGDIDIESLSRKLNQLGQSGWHIVGTLSNYTGLTFNGVQHTGVLREGIGQISQNVLILERCIHE